MCAFRIFLHWLSWAQSSTVTSVLRRQNRTKANAESTSCSKCSLSAVLEQICILKASITAEPTNPPSTPCTVLCSASPSGQILPLCICFSLCLDCSSPSSSHGWLPLILHASVLEHLCKEPYQETTLPKGDLHPHYSLLQNPFFISLQLLQDINN